jgi:hypothetical protein
VRPASLLGISKSSARREQDIPLFDVAFLVLHQLVTCKHDTYDYFFNVDIPSESKQQSQDYV